MENNLRLIMWTVIGVIAVWLLTMSVSRILFFNYDVIGAVNGRIAINDTDINDQCGSDAKNQNAIVDYKLNFHAQIIYLCPQSWWPWQSRVAAVVLTPKFRAGINPIILEKLNKYYPPARPTPTPPPNPYSR